MNRKYLKLTLIILSVIALCLFCLAACEEDIPAETTEAVHVHVIVTYPASDPTCTKEGMTEGQYCSVCNTVTVTQTAIPALGHNEVTDPAIAATCTKAGKTEGKHCSVCNTVTVRQNTIPKTAHTEVTDPAVASTCSTAGKTAGKHCSVCNTVTIKQNTIPKTAHTEVTDPAIPATCTTEGKTEGKHCSVCNAVTVKPKQLGFGNHWAYRIEKIENQCYSEGTLGAYGFCLFCNHITSSTPIIERKGHIGNPCQNCGVKKTNNCSHAGTVVTLEAIPADCITAGFTEGKYCSACGECFEVQRLILPTGHSFNGVSDMYCNVCNFYRANTCDHSYGVFFEESSNPDCIGMGWIGGSFCNKCKQRLTNRTMIPALGHAFDSDQDETCNNCGMIRKIPCDHKGTTQYPSSLAPTCLYDGYKNGSHCTKCHEVITAQTVLPALGHSEVTTSAVAATCTASGKTSGKHCSTCGYVFTAVSPAKPLGHSMSGNKCTLCGYTSAACAHSNKKKLDAVAATAEYPGLTEGLICSDCGEILKKQEYCLGKASPTECFLTTEETTIAREDFLIVIPAGMYVPANIVEFIETAIEYAEELTGWELHSDYAYTTWGKTHSDLRLRVNINSLPTGISSASRNTLTIARSDLLPGSNAWSTIIHELTHVLHLRNGGNHQSSVTKEGEAAYWETQWFNKSPYFISVDPISQYYDPGSEIDTINADNAERLFIEYEDIPHKERGLEYAYGFRLITYLNEVGLYDDYRKWIAETDKTIDLGTHLKADEIAALWKKRFGNDFFEKFGDWNQKNKHRFALSDEADMQDAERFRFIEIFPYIVPENQKASYSRYRFLYSEQLVLDLTGGYTYAKDYAKDKWNNKLVCELYALNQAKATAYFFDADGNLIKTVELTNKATTYTVEGATRVMIEGDGNAVCFEPVYDKMFN